MIRSSHSEALVDISPALQSLRLLPHGLLQLHKFSKILILQWSRTAKGVQARPATIHFSTIRYVSRYSCHDTIHDMICYITTKQEGYCFMSCSWAQKSVQLTSLVLKITLNTLSMDLSRQFVRKIAVHKD